MMQREISRREILTRAVGMAVGVSVSLPAATAGQTSPSSHAPAQGSNAPMFVPLGDVKWQRIPPFPGRPAPKPKDPWPEIAILREAPVTKATQLMIRVPKSFHVPKHWHTANETHTVVSGTFIMACEGQKAELGPGSFNYMPSKMVHEAWTKLDEGALLFITVDGPWDVNFMPVK